MHGEGLEIKRPAIKKSVLVTLLIVSLEEPGEARNEGVGSPEGFNKPLSLPLKPSDKRKRVKLGQRAEPEKSGTCKKLQVDLTCDEMLGSEEFEFEVLKESANKREPSEEFNFMALKKRADKFDSKEFSFPHDYRRRTK